MTKQEYEKELLEVRTELIKTQYTFNKYNRPMILVLSGMDGSGKGELVNFLADVMDTRMIEVATFWQESDEEAERPYYYRFWKEMPMGGKLGIYFNGWYDRLVRKFLEDIDDISLFESKLESAADFEKMLALDGTVVVKVWAHIEKKEQKKRLDKLAKKFKDTPEIEERALWYYKKYDKVLESFNTAYRKTHSRFAPWEVIDCSDKKHREIQFLKIILNNMQRAIGDQMPKSETTNVAGLEFPDKLASVNLQVDYGDTYRKDLEELTADIKKLSWEAYDRGLSSMMVFEGWDAAGKGGCIRRLLRALDMRLASVVSIAAPTTEEISRHYLWRFWKHVPRAGRVSIFDRSWYGRVLVERIEGFAPASDWYRGYEEINSFEKHLAERGVKLMKFFLHIDSDEQLSRFQQREETPWKQHKITEEDYRNREKLQEYTDAYNEMFFKTDTRFAGWNIISANNKKFARIQVMKAVKDAYIKMLAE
jgi:polyphosphate:AMP phosphotransferase